MKKELQILKEIEPIAKQAETLEITNNESLKEATSLLSRLNKYNDDIIEEMERITVPAREIIKREQSRWKPAMTYYKTGIEAIRLKMKTYQTNLVNSQQQDKQRIASRIGEGKGHLKVETAIKQLETLPIIEKETATEEGLVQFREKKQLKITNLSTIPDLYWHVSEDMLLEDLKKGFIIPGAEIEIIQVPVNYR